MNLLNKKGIISLLVIGMFVSGIGVSNLRAETQEQCIAKCEIDKDTCRTVSTISWGAALVGCAALSFWGTPAAGYICYITVDAIYVGALGACEVIYNGCVAKCNVE